MSIRFLDILTVTFVVLIVVLFALMVIAKGNSDAITNENDPDKDKYMNMFYGYLGGMIGAIILLLICILLRY
jgi:hypothetical protein